MRYRLPANFPERVRDVVRRIPFGCVATYGQVAALAGGPRHARFVGRILRTADEILPWHRVVNHLGSLSLPRGAGYEVQRALLEQEGVVFDERDRIDLERFGWRPGPQELHNLGLSRAARRSSPPR